MFIAALCKTIKNYKQSSLTNEWITKLHSYNGLLLNNKKGWTTDTHHTTVKSQMHYTQDLSSWKSVLPVQGVKVQLLVGELRSHMPCGMAIKKKEKKTNALYLLRKARQKRYKPYGFIYMTFGKGHTKKQM